MNAEWFLKSGEKILGPYSLLQMSQLAERGQIKGTSKVRHGSFGQWVEAGTVKLLSGKLTPPSLTAASGTQPPPRRAQKPVTVSPVTGLPTFAWIIISGASVLLAGILVIAFVVRSDNRVGAPKSTPTTTMHDEPVRDSEFHEERSSKELNNQEGNPGEFAAARKSGKQLSTEEIVARTEQSIALIKGRLGTGTGFVMKPGVIVSNHHVVASELMKNIQIHFPSAAEDKRGPYPAELICEDPRRDLAFLRVAINHRPLSTTTDFQFRRGREVTVIGNPGVGGELILQNAVSRGVLSTMVTIDDQEYYQLGIAINPGNSGGPALDSFGQVIGVVTLKASREEGLAFCVPASRLVEATRSALQLTDDQIARNKSMHRVRAVFAAVSVTGELYKRGMQTYTRAMRIASDNGDSVDEGLEAVRDDVETTLTVYDQLFIADLKQEISVIGNDDKIPLPTRKSFIELWTNYVQLKSYVDSPRGTLDSYTAKCIELSDAHDHLKDSLRIRLGLDSP